MKRVFWMIAFVGVGTGLWAQADTTRPELVIKPQILETPEADSIYEVRTTKTHLNGHYIPKDLYDCFRELNKLMDPAVKEKFMAFSDEEVDPRTHASLGKWLEARWGLREGSRLSKYFRKIGVPHPDYMVGVVIRSYHRHLHERELDLKGQITEFKAHWKERRQRELRESRGY